MNNSPAIAFHPRNMADTERLGAALADHLPAGTTVALCGTLGAGKTRLVQSVALASNVAEGVVVSPTFVLAQHYAGNRVIHHFDTYRLRDCDEFLDLGPEECFDSTGITFVEWADRVAEVLPLDHLRIEIEVLGETERQFLLTATGPKADAALDLVRRTIAD